MLVYDIIYEMIERKIKFFEEKVKGTIPDETYRGSIVAYRDVQRLMLQLKRKAGKK